MSESTTEGPRKAFLESLNDQELYEELGFELPEELDLKAVSPIIDEISSWDRKTLIYALTIGDGSIHERNRLEITHGQKQKSYTQFKYHILKQANLL